MGWWQERKSSQHYYEVFYLSSIHFSAYSQHASLIFTRLWGKHHFKSNEGSQGTKKFFFNTFFMFSWQCLYISVGYSILLRYKYTMGHYLVKVICIYITSDIYHFFPVLGTFKILSTNFFWNMQLIVVNHSYPTEGTENLFVHRYAAS